MQKIIHLSILCFFILSVGVAQTQSSNYSILVLDFSSNEIHKNIQLLGNNYSFKSIYIKNASQKISTKFLGNFHFISKLKIENSSNLAINSIFESLRQGVQIDTLEFVNANYDKTLLGKTSLKASTIIFDDCDNEVVDDILRSILNQDQIKNLKINYCSMKDIISPILKFKNLEELNLNDNLISGLPAGFSNLKKLKTLKLTGNYFENIPDDFAKLKFMQIDNLEIEKPYEDEVEIVQKYLPQTKIKFVESQSFKTAEQNIEVGEIKVESSTKKILSSAYLSYPKLMASPLSRTIMDTIRFEEKFNDTTYNSRVLNKNLNRQYSNFKIYKQRSSLKGKTAFGFLPLRIQWWKKNQNVNYGFFKYYREMEIFVGYQWILDDTMSRQSLNKLIKEKVFTDLRLHYNPSEKNFDIILKCENTFIIIKAFPIIKTKKNIELIKEQYPGLYSAYIKKLSLRGKLYNKKVAKDCSMIYAADLRYKQGIWQEIRNQMSPQEREMSSDEWMKYYASITNNEMEALLNATPDYALVERALKIKKYLPNNNFITTVSDTTSRKVFINYRILITDQMGNTLPVTSFIIVNKTDMTYRYYPGQTALNYIALFLNNTDDYVWIGFQSDNSISVTKLSEIADYKRIPADHIPVDLSSIQQIVTTLEL